jgi:hypothetical protein
MRTMRCYCNYCNKFTEMKRITESHHKNSVYECTNCRRNHIETYIQRCKHTDIAEEWLNHPEYRKDNRNDKCKCGSGLKYKHCHYKKFKELYGTWIYFYMSNSQPRFAEIGDYIP